MKKIVILFVLLISLSAMTLAQGVDQLSNINKPAAADTVQQTVQTENAVKNIEEIKSLDKEQKMNSLSNKNMAKLGMENALSNIKNEEARARIQKNMDSFMNKYQHKLETAKSVDVKINEEASSMKVMVKKQVKFLGLFKGSSTETFEVESEGKVKEHKPWYRFMYKEISSESSDE